MGEIYYFSINLVKYILSSSLTLLLVYVIKRNKISMGNVINSRSLLYVIISFIFLMIFNNKFLLLTSIIFYIIGIYKIYDKSTELIFISYTYIVLIIVNVIIYNLSFFWIIISNLFLNISATLGHYFSSPANYGYFFGGFNLFLYSTILSSYIIKCVKSNVKNQLYAITINIIILFVYLILSSYITNFMIYHIIWFKVGLMLVYGFIPIFYFFKIGDLNIDFDFTKLHKINYLKYSFVFLLLFLIMYVPTNNHVSNIAFYSKGILDWNLPSFGTLGLKTIGMFGLLPDYLESAGNNVVFIDQINDVNLVSVDVLVMINIDHLLLPEEHRSVWSFVERGGGLLILGDHTDLRGVMNSTNILLSPTNIRFKFDSGFHFKRLWDNCLTLLPHQINYGVNKANEIFMGIGASLDIDYPAEPIIISNFAFSDWGNYKNVQGAYLGNYQYNSGEQVGDIILCAEERIGEGKVVVFGDTSPFQNPCVPYNYKFILNVFSYLSSNNVLIKNNWISLFFVIIISVILYDENKTMNEKRLIMAASIISLSLMLSNASIFNNGKYEVGSKVAFIDITHCNQFNMEPWTEDSVGGLIINLIRNDYKPILLRDFNDILINENNLLIMIAPVQSLTSKEIRLIESFTNNGGNVILSFGWKFRNQQKNLLNLIGLDIAPIPLGPYPYFDTQYIRRGSETKFFDSWKIIHNEQCEIIYEATLDGDTYSIVAKVDIGAGSIVLISDDKFLLDKNLESEDDYWPGNVFFLKELIERLEE